MRASLLAAALVLALAAAALCSDGAAAADAVADSCAAIRDFVDPAFCASRLRSVPGAAAADRHRHLLMAADLAAASGAAAAGMARDDSAGAGEPTPAARDALQACGFLYSAGSVPALRLLRGYAAARSWGAARSPLLLAEQAGVGCEAALGSGSGAGRMAAANREFQQLVTMTVALLNTVSS